MHTTSKCKSRFRPAFLIGCCAVLTLLFGSGVAGKKCCPPGTSEEVRQEIEKLYELSGMEPHTGIVVASLSSQALDTLLAALQHDSYLVRGHAIEMLIGVLGHTDVSRQVARGQILPAISQLMKDSTADDESRIGSTIELGHLALWSAEQHALDDTQKVPSLLDAVKGPDNSRMRLAIDHLVRIGSEEARVGLLRAAERKEKQGLNEAAYRIKLGADRITIQMKLETLDATEKVSYLTDWLNDFIMRKKGWGVQEFVIWLITEIGLRDNDAAVVELRKVWRNQTFDVEYRYAAQEALIRLKIIEPKEREIRFE